MRQGPGTDKPGRAHPLSVAGAWVLPGALTLGLLLWLASFTQPPPAWCPGQVEVVAADGAASLQKLPIARPPLATAGSTLHIVHEFVAGPGARAIDAIYLGEAMPFYRLRLNGIELTPPLDLDHASVRDRQPHLHHVAAGLLHPGANRIEIELPLRRDLGRSSLDHLCLGDYAQLKSVHTANWWRMVAPHWVALSLLAVLSLVALLLYGLGGRQRANLWYVATLAPFMLQTLHFLLAERPLPPLVWQGLVYCGLTAVVYFFFRFVSTFFALNAPRLERALRVYTLVAVPGFALAYFSGVLWRYPAAFFLHFIVVLALVVVVLLTLMPGLRRAPRHELRVIKGSVLCFLGCGVLDLLDSSGLLRGLPSTTLTLGSGAVGLSFGYLLLRRAALGAQMLIHARGTLANDLDRALSMPDGAGGEQVWSQLTASIADSERRRMLRDIHDGFGSRLVALLVRIRRVAADSGIQGEIQRAILDMRLMIDAVDEHNRTLEDALAMLRYRLEPVLLAAGIASTWDCADGTDCLIDDRRGLMSLFRCLEELLSNVIQHAQATRVAIAARVRASGEFTLSVRDDGRGLDAAVPRSGQGMRNIGTRVAALRGVLAFDAGLDGRGLGVSVSLPGL